MVDPAAADAVPEAVARVADWDGWMALAGRNRLLPVVTRTLHGMEGVPAEVRDRLRAASERNAGEALRLSAELRRLLSALEAEGVRAVAYKGPALAVRAYGDPGLRTYSDLDLLVSPAQVDAALAVLRVAGYESSYAFTPAQNRRFRAVDGDYPLHHPVTGALVEVHAQVSSARFRVRLPTDVLMRRAQPVAVGGGTVRALADDDLFLALCVHGAKHRWARLEWLVSAAALAARTGLDLSKVSERAWRIGAGRTVLLALHLASTALALSIPATVAHAAAADADVPALADEARSLWFTRAANDSSVAKNLRFNLRLRDTRADRLRFAAHWLFTPTPEDWGWLRLPDALAPLYRAVRPLRLALRYAPGRRG
jgi:DNA-binding transcriptional ArsR family regulator